MASPFTPPIIPGAQGYPLGLTGATAATRYVGATASGAPASGTFAVGDFAIDQTGKVYVCTVAGSPGTWAQAGGGTSAGTDGWVDDSAATWTRTGNQTFTVTGDRTAVFRKGAYLRWTQTTVKYGTVYSSSHAAGTTTVTIITNTDYVLTAAAISVNGYSYAATPSGFPASFAYTPTWSSTGTQPAVGNGSLTGSYLTVGTLAFVRVALVIGGTSTAGTGLYALGLPVAYVGGANGTGYVQDAGTAEYLGTSRGGITNADLAIMYQTNALGTSYWAATAPMVPAATDQAVIHATYPF